MGNLEIDWPGASGKMYHYWIHELPCSFNPNQNGNYIFCKIVNNKWIPIYIGQGDLNERVNDDDHYNCATRKGATHVHVHTSSTERARLSEEQDLLDAYPQAYAPTGCNKKAGG